MTLLMLVRHGETEDNRLQVFQGHGGSPLNEAGKAQAARLSQRLADVAIAEVIASDLERAQQTAEIIANTHKITIRLDARLREVDVGAWQGLGQTAIQARFPDEWEAWRRGEDKRRGGGETYQEAGARAKQLVLECHMVPRDDDEIIVMVSHAGTIRALTSQLMNAPLDAFAPVRNTGLTCIEWSQGRGKLHVWSDATHDRDPVSFLPRKR
jgi:broad specificity phosphatase PhoE